MGTTENRSDLEARLLGPCTAVGSFHYKHSDSCVCQGTGKRFPTLWKKCLSQTHSPCTREIECYPVSVFEYELIEDCNGTGWIPDISEAKLWDIAGDIGMSSVVEKLPYDSLYDWMKMLTEEQRLEALEEAVTALQTASLE